ncbi:MAG: flagellar biosynthetic protein FliO [Rhizobacter sp.]|jgi:flagellar protein FliO/FliZ
MDSFSSQLLSTLLALAFVGLLAWVSIAMLKRLQQGRLLPGARADAGELRFVRALPVGAKERIVVMHYRGEEWVLGVTSGGISLLSREPQASASSDAVAHPVSPNA